MNIKPLLMVFLAACCVINVGQAIAKSPAVSDSQVKENIIEESIASYPGVCACPFNQMRNGRACGGRSAWSKAGGYAPICYKKEVTADMVQQWRDENNS